MEAIYWGSGCGGGVGKGPWVHADLEDGCRGGNASVNPNPGTQCTLYTSAAPLGPGAR